MEKQIIYRISEGRGGQKQTIMTTKEFYSLVNSCACYSVREFSILMLGPQWTRGLYQSLQRQLAEGHLTGWPAALAEKTALLHGENAPEMYDEMGNRVERPRRR